MNITVIQPDIKWEDKTANFTEIEKLVIPLFNKTDLVILPEMFNTGFSMNPGALAEAPCMVTYAWMRSISSKGNFGLCGSYIIKDGSVYYNRWVFVSPDGGTYQYDKRHLFSMGGEDKLFSQGRSRVVFNFRGIRMAPFICYDLRFPVWSRNHNDYDLAIYSANWPEVRRNVWRSMLIARAIENQAYVAGSNRIGTDGTGIRYHGESMIVDPKGEIMAKGDDNKICSVTCTISPEELESFRQKFPVMNDADDFIISL